MPLNKNSKDEFVKSDYFNFMSCNNLTDFLILEDSSKDFNFFIKWKSIKNF